MFRTYEPTRDRLVAVKAFRLDITPEQAQSLADELARAAEAGLFHPSIVEPIAAGVQGTVAYRADEYVAAESLDVAMRHYAPATLDKVLPFITQLAGAIDFARAAGVGHGALHLRDIFVTPDEARASGFGVVEALERLGLRAPVRRPYSAPERIDGKPWGTPADVFSLAVVAYELLTGRRPSGLGEQIGALMGASVDEQAEPLRAVLARAMHDDPAERYPTALAFAAALEAAARPGAPAPVAVAKAAPTPIAVPLRKVEDKPAGPVPVETPQGARGEDDIEAEREEDEAHWALSQEELSKPASAPEVEEVETLFEDEEVEAAADRLVFDAADLALSTSDKRPDTSFGDEFARVDRQTTDRQRDEKPIVTSAAGIKPPEEPHRTIAPVVPPVRPREPSIVAPPHEEPAPRFGTLLHDTTPVESRQRSGFPMLPVAVALLVGLPLAFGAGYVVGQRRNANEPAAQSAESRTATDAAQTAPTSGGPAKPYSEQTVAPASPSTSPSAPAATPPGVPGDAPVSEKAPAPARPTPQAPRSGTLVVRSTPAGASVTVNGQWRGRTPLTLSELAFGDYVVRVVSPGYDVAREEFELTSTDASRNMSVRLQRQRAATPPAAAPRAAAAPPRGTTPAPSGQPQAFTGSVFVDSRPRGAKVFIDGKEVGTTPLRVPEVGIGAHVIRLELADHRVWANSVRVSAGAEARVTGSLEPIIR